MALINQSTAVLALAVGGALLQAGVTLRLYEPPPPGDAAETTPTPVFESALFAVIFGLLYVVAGLGLGVAEGISPTLGPAVVAVVVVVAVAAGYATATGRIGNTTDPAQRALRSGAMGTVGAIGAAVLLL